MESHILAYLQRPLPVNIVPFPLPETKPVDFVTSLSNIEIDENLRIFLQKLTKERSEALVALERQFSDGAIKVIRKVHEVD